LLAFYHTCLVDTSDWPGGVKWDIWVGQGVIRVIGQVGQVFQGRSHGSGGPSGPVSQFIQQGGLVTWIKLESGSEGSEGSERSLLYGKVGQIGQVG
jgi:hypothetical protein